MKPHHHFCPQHGAVWSCRGFLCVERRDMDCPDCEGDESDSEDEDEE